MCERCLAAEIMDAANNTGASVKEEDVHKMAEATRRLLTTVGSLLPDKLKEGWICQENTHWKIPVISVLWRH